jgi:hypothetical protein
LDNYFAGGKEMMNDSEFDIYNNGTYFANNPSWHEQDSSWKAMQVYKIIESNNLQFSNMCEIGCGAGEIINQLFSKYKEKIEMCGYEISQQAFNICQKKSKPGLEFKLSDLLLDQDAYYDIVMAIDVLEHIDNYIDFLRKLKNKGRYKIFHIPLDLSVQSVLRLSPIIKSRKSVGHIHYFTKETALETLIYAGHEIVEYFYTGASLDLPNRGWKANLLKIPRRLAFLVNKDITVRVLGGYSLMVLTK